jgi:hypothetical protein
MVSFENGVAIYIFEQRAVNIPEVLWGIQNWVQIGYTNKKALLTKTAAGL